MLISSQSENFATDRHSSVVVVVYHLTVGRIISSRDVYIYFFVVRSGQWHGVHAAVCVMTSRLMTSRDVVMSRDLS